MTETTTRGAGPAARAHHAGGDGPAPETPRRMSAKRKHSAVLRLLRGEDLELLSRQLSVPAAELRAAGFSRSFLIGETGVPLELRERTGMATRGGAQVLVLIHQDSVQPRDLPTWTLQGRVREYTPCSGLRL
jgi:hypothetical protein